MSKVITYKRLSPAGLLRTSISLIGGRTGSGKTRQMWNVIGSKVSQNIPVAVFCENGIAEVPQWAYNNPLIHIFGMNYHRPNFSVLERVNVRFVFVDEVRISFDIEAGYSYCFLIHSSDKEQSISKLRLFGFDDKTVSYVSEGRVCYHVKETKYWNSYSD